MVGLSFMRGTRYAFCLTGGVLAQRTRLASPDVAGPSALSAALASGEHAAASARKLTIHVRISHLVRSSSPPFNRQWCNLNRAWPAPCATSGLLYPSSSSLQSRRCRDESLRAGPG